MIKDKVSTLRALMRVCLNWFTLLKIYFLGGAGTVYLRDAFGNKVDVYVEPSNVRLVLFLTMVLNDLFGYYKFLCKDNKHYIYFYTRITKAFDLPNPVNIDAVFYDWKLQDLLSLIRFMIMNSDDIIIRSLSEKYVDVLVKNEGLVFTVRKRNWYDLSHGAFIPYFGEPYIYTSWFLRILSVRSHPVFIDVGAYIGGYTVRACKLGAKVIVIEPDSENFFLLTQNVNNNCANNKVFLFNVAAGKREIRVPYYEEEFPLLLTVSEEAASKNEERKRVRGYATIKPLDHIIPPLLNANEVVDLLKIDVEMATLEVLEGASDVLSKARYVIIELHPPIREEGMEILHEHGFVIVDRHGITFLFKQKKVDSTKE